MYTPIIETKRLILRKLKKIDEPQLIEMLGDPLVMRWLFGKGPMTQDEARSFIDENFIFGKQIHGLGVLCVRDTGYFVGFAGLLPCRYLYEDDFEIGFALEKGSWGKGYATEIGMAQIEYGFRNFNVRRLLGLVDPQNTASWRALEKIGMRLIKTIHTDERGPRRIYMIKRST